MLRKPALGAILGAILTLSTGGASLAQEAFPNRPVQLIMPFGPGGSDAMFRAFAASMSNVMKQQFVVINREGASGRIGTSQVAVARLITMVLQEGHGTESLSLDLAQSYKQAQQ